MKKLNTSNLPLVKDFKIISLMCIIMYSVIYIVLSLVTKNNMIIIPINIGIIIAFIVYLNQFIKKRLNYLDYIMNSISKSIEEDMDIEIIVKEKHSLCKLAENINTLSIRVKESIYETKKNDIRDIRFIKEISKNYELDEDELRKILNEERNKLIIKKEKFKLRSILEGISSVYKNDFEFLEIEFRYNIPKNLSLVNGDENLIKEVLREIYMNILKHGLSKSKVYIEAKEKDNKVHLSIKSVAKEDINENSIRDGKFSGIRFIENSLFIQNIDYNLSVEASLFKIEIVFDLS